MKTMKNYEVNYCVIFRIGYRNSKRVWLMKVFLLSHRETHRMNIETLPVLLMNYLQSREPKWYRVNTTSSLTSRKTEIARAVRGRKLQGPRAEDAMAEPYLVLKNFGDLITADHKVLSESCESRNNHHYAVVVQDLATQWLQSYPCKTKTSQKNQKRLQKFLEPTRKPKVI